MKKYKNITSKFLTLAMAAALTTGCYDFTELNEDPYNQGYVDGETEEPTEPETPDTIPGVDGKYKDLDINYTLSDKDIQALKDGQKNIGAIFFNYTYDGYYNDYQTTTNLSHDIYAGYTANNKPDFKFNSPNYGYTDGWNANRWDHFYNDRTLREYSVLIKTFHFVDPAKYKNAFYMTRIYWAFLALAQTDTYGDIPLSAYAQGKEPKAPIKYDTQEEAYDLIFRILEQAVDSITPGACEFKFAADEDHCYHGDETKWLRFANTLRLRAALRISNIDPVRAKAEGEAAMSNKWGLMQSQEDNMVTVPKFATTHAGNENALAMCSFAYNGDAVMAKDLELAYKNQSIGGGKYEIRGVGKKVINPRCLICWWRPTPFNSLKKQRENPKNDFTGCEIGSDDIQHTASVEKYSVTRTDVNDKGLNPKNWYNYSQESVWLSYAETQFLLAEAALRGWSGANQSPEAYFKAGIQASMDYYQINAADAQSYIDGLHIYQDAENPFANGDKEGMLEQIITQKWLAVFPNGNEGWAEFRRTDYPRLKNILNNRSNGEVPEGKFIKRMNYPFSEKDNVNKPSREEYDYLGHRLWWDVADTNNDNGERNTPNNFR